MVNAAGQAALPRVPVRVRRFAGAASAAGVLPFVVSLVLVAIATLIGVAGGSYFSEADVTLFYLTAVLAAAARFGLTPALVAAVISVLALDFLFIPPIYSLTIDTPRDALALTFFSIVAVVTSGLASRLRHQMLLARGHAETTAKLYAFSRQLAQLVALQDLLSAAVSQIGAMLPVEAIILLADAGELPGRVQYPSNARIPGAALAAIDSAWRQGEPTGLGTGAFANAPSLFMPLRATSGTAGILVVTPLQPGLSLTADQRQLLDALAELTGIVIERQLLADQIARLQVDREADRLRSVLLTSIAHDLRGPVSAVVTALSGLDTDYRRLDEETRQELLTGARQDAGRLDRFVGNLLDMTRIESGLLPIRREPVDIGDIAGSALAHARSLLGARRIDITIPPDLPFVPADIVLLEQVVFNLLENAAKYTPAESTIAITAKQAGDRIVVTVTDEGPGITNDGLERVFEKFYRSGEPSGAIAGTGLGLAICRGFVEAHGGTITAGNRTDRSGAIFTIELPAGRAASAAG